MIVCAQRASRKLRRSYIRFIVGVLLTIASVLFLRQFPWRHALGALGSASPLLVLLAMFLKLIAIGARAERVHAMLHRELVVGRVAILRYLVCGFAADNLIASTAGVAVRGILLVRHGGARARSVIGALALEKYVDGTFMGMGLWVIV